MPECPFCHSEIDEHLAVHGGTCPSCFAEVPGEEAPTDPGAAVRARLEKEDAKVVRRSRLPVVVLVLLLLGVVGGAAWIVTRPPPMAPVLNFDDEAWDFEIEIVAAPEDEPEPEPDVASRQVRPQPRQSGVDRLLAQDDVNLDDLGQAGQDGLAMGGTRGTRQIDGMEGDIAPDQLSLGGPSFGLSTDEAAMMSVQRRRIKGETLTDDSQIIEMVRGVLEQQIPRLQTCYQRRLRVDPSLRGSWILEFVLTAEGQATEITVVGDGVADAELETCIAGKVQDWFFQPIKEALPVRKTLRFRPR